MKTVMCAIVSLAITLVFAQAQSLNLLPGDDANAGAASDQAVPVIAPGLPKTQAAMTRPMSLGTRLACQTAIEQVYWRHRISPGKNVTKPSFNDAVPQEVIRRKAEEVILKSLALERYWGVTITGEQLQAELDRMAANSKSPDVLAELFAAVGNDPEAAAECLARPLLVDRLIQTYFASDQRLHGELKARVQTELAGAASATMKKMSGQYREMEWQRGRKELKPGVMALESGDFDERVRGLRSTLGDRSGNLALGRLSSLREDANRFYAVAVMAQDADHVCLASIEWPKVSFATWWRTTRQQLPMQLAPIAYRYALPRLAPNGNCRDDSWKPTMQLLDPRYFHTAVWTGTEMIVWGGSNAVGTYYNDGSRYNPATDTYTLVASLGAPFAREAHVAVWTGKEMVIFGGRGDTTGGKYDPVTDTWKATSQAGAPTGQQYAAAVWTGKEMIVWGGVFLGAVNTGARYNPTTDTWTTLPPVALAPRAYMPAVWTGSEMIVWGGGNNQIGQVYNDGARYNPTTNTWNLTNPIGAASARYWHTAVWTGKEMIVWGGFQAVFDQSGGRYDPATDTWTPTSLVNPPSLRWLHSAVWTGQEMIIQGGTGGPSDHSVGGRYFPATDSWKPTNPTNAADNGQGITAVWTGKEMIVWGGLDNNFVFHNDGGRYDPGTDSWLRTSTMNVPGARSFHSSVWTGSEMIIWGGIGDVVLSDGGRYDPVTDNWMTIVPFNNAGGGDGQAVWTGSEAIFWVGSNPGGRYNPATDSWELMSIVNAPLETLGHTTVWTGTELIVYGGISSSLNAKRYKPATDTWTDATMVNDPGHRDHQGAVWTGTEMIVWGGSIDDGYVGPEGGRYNPTTDTWALMSPSGLDALRMFPVSVWTGTEVIFWGGYNQLFIQYFNDGGRYNPVTNSWTQTSLANAPFPRIAQGVWTGTEMLLWGGVDDSSGGRYNPTTNSWMDTTLVNSPIVRGGGRWSTVWTGNQMIIWGGYIETQQGSLYCASGTPNSAPVASDDYYTALAGTQLVVGPNSGVLFNDTDANADLLTANVLTQPAHGTLQLNANGSFLYRPVAGFVGPDSFTYQANDGLALSNIATVNITVQTPTTTPTPTPTPIATATPTPTPTVAPTPTPSPSPTTKAINLSTRMQVQAGDNVGIGGFIITGSAPKRVLIRGIGPSLSSAGLANALADPVLELHGPGVFVTIINNNWRDTQETEIQSTGIPPNDDLEAAIVVTLNPGAYTAIIRGNGNTSGVALVEVYDLNQGVDSKLANLSTRASVGTGADIVIAGFMLGGNGAADRIVVRGIGPSLIGAGVPNGLTDPTLELRDSNGALLVANNDWQEDPVQAAEITAAGLAPTNDLESGIAATLPPGLYTALLAGLNNGTGIGVVEVYDRGATP